jgi:hypothetical protein
VNWTDYKVNGFGWSIGSDDFGRSALVMGPLPDGTHIVHADGDEPVATFQPVDAAKAMAESRLEPIDADELAEGAPKTDPAPAGDES